MHASLDFRTASRTYAPAIDLEILPQREDSTQLQKTERKDPGIGDDGPEFRNRNVTDFGEWTDPRAEEHLVLDDVADTRKNGLIEQNVRNFGTRECADFLERRSRVPLVRHHVRREVVCSLRVRIFYEFHGRRPDGDLSIGKIENEARGAGPPVIARYGFAADRRRKRPPKHEVDAQRERIELKDEMFSPREDLVHG
jgi:hypothetical protein